MTQLEIGPDRIQIDAEIVAKALKIDAQDLLSRMRDGTVTSRFERGEGTDAGRVRLTFFSATRRARITASEAGAVLSCSTADYDRSPPAPSKLRQGNRPLDALLDVALPETLPASDPVAVRVDSGD